MKKVLISLLSLGTLLLTAGCAKELVGPDTSGDTVQATFNVTLPGEVATKAFGIGTAATNLTVAVYDEAGHYLQDLSESATRTGDAPTWMVTMKVVKDLTYKFVFLAKSSSAFCSFNPANAQVSIDYGALKANDDAADFFYAYDSFKIEDGFTQDENMVRPLSQMNFGASDLTEAEYSIKTDATMLTGVTLTGIYSGMNLLTGDVIGDPDDVTFEKAPRVPAEDPKFVPGYDRIAMVYALVKAEQPTVTATLNVSAQGAENTTPHTITREVTNVPLKRNYRTNILGNLFTSNFTFTVETKHGFYAPDYMEIAGTTIAKANTAFASGATSTTIDVDPVTAGDGQTTITLPQTTEDVRVRLNFTSTETITIQYADAGSRPANVEIFALDVSEVIADLAASHVVITAGSKITTGTFATSSTTLVVEPAAEVTNLKIKAGKVQLENGFKVQRISRTEDNQDKKTIVEVEAGLASYPVLDGNVEFNKTITGVTIEKTDEEAIYSVTTAAHPESALEAIVDDINTEPKEKVSIGIAPGASIEWATGAYSGSTPIIPSSNTTTKEVVIDGGGSGVLVATGKGVGDVRAAGDGTLVFKNMIIEDHSVSYMEGSWEYGYLEFSGKVRFENCTIRSSITLEDDDDTNENEFTFTDCKFISDETAADWNPNPEQMYLVWVSAGNATFTNCDFTGYRGIKVHNQYAPYATGYSGTLVVDECNFHDITVKTAVDMGTIAPSASITIKNSTFKNCAKNNGTMIYKSTTATNTFTFVLEKNIQMLADGLILDDAGNYMILSANGLVAAADYYKNGGTFKLENDIDMTGVEYESPVMNSLASAFVFDGNGKTISNMSTKVGETHAGLFGQINPNKDITIKDLTIKNATLNPSNANAEYAAGALIGWTENHSNITYSIQNVTVDGVTVNSTKYAGGLIGWAGSVPATSLVIDGCVVKNSTIKSAFTKSSEAKDYQGHAGGVVGYLQDGTIQNTTVADSKIEYALPYKVNAGENGPRAGALAGTAQEKAVIGTGNKVSNFYINETKVTEQVIGAVDNRSDKTTNVTIE